MDDGLTCEGLDSLESDLSDEYDVPQWLKTAAQELIIGAKRLLADRDLYRDLAEQLYQTDSCSFDHHGGCQAHLWLDLQPGEECPDGRAQRLFAEKDKTDADAT